MSTKRSKLREQSAYSRKPWLKHYDFWVPEQMNFPRQPIHQILNLAALQFTDRPATAFREAQLTFGEIKAQVDQLATALARMGIGKGDRVGIMLPNCPQYVIAAFAVLRIGAIVVNVNPLYTPREIGVVARDSGMRLLIALDVLAPGAFGIVETIVVTSAAEYSAAAAECPKVEGTQRLAELLACEHDLPRVRIDPENDVAVLQYTGGTTGTPKGATLTE